MRAHRLANTCMRTRAHKHMRAQPHTHTCVHMFFCFCGARKRAPRSPYEAARRAPRAARLTTDRISKRTRTQPKQRERAAPVHTKAWQCPRYQRSRKDEFRTHSHKRACTHTRTHIRANMFLPFRTPGARNNAALRAALLTQRRSTTKKRTQPKQQN